MVSVLSNRLAWVLLVSVIAALYNFGINAEIVAESQLANVTLFIGFPLTLVWWVQEDARSTRYWPAYHYGLWIFVAAPIVVPHYLMRTRGIAGIPPMLILLGAMLAPLLAAHLGAWAHPYVPEWLWLPES